MSETDQLPVPDSELPEDERLSAPPATDMVKVPAQGDPEPADPGQSPLDAPNTVEDDAGTPAPEETEV